MKKFFTTAFACTLGTLIAGLLLMILLIIGMTGAIASSVATGSEVYIPQKNTVLKLELSGSLQERYMEDPMQELMSNGSATQGLDQMRKAIKVAAENEKIVGIYIDERGMSAMPA